MYSSTWRRIFGSAVDIDLTSREAAFVLACIGKPRATVLDVCCGDGRHAAELQAAGCEGVGVDNDACVVEAARARGLAGWRFDVGDARALGSYRAMFDASLCMWQSFGFGPDHENEAVLHGLSEAVRPGGTVVLDIYNPAFFREHEGVREIERRGELVRETKSIRGSRLTVRLEYASSSDVDEFTWRMYERAEIERIAAGARLTLEAWCTDWDRLREPKPKDVRVQFVMKRMSAGSP